MPLGEDEIMLVRFSMAALSLPIVLAIPAGAQGPAQTPHGTFENGVYRHNLTDIECSLPPDWVVASQEPAPQPSAQVVLVSDFISNVTATVWLKQREAAPRDEAAPQGRS